MINRRPITTSLLLVILALRGAQCTGQEFPAVRYIPLTLLGAWESAPLVVVGEARNIQAVGTQKVKNLPWPAPPTVNLIYWCKATLSVSTSVKGRFPIKEKQLLWGAIRPGCNLYLDDQNGDGRPAIRVWFVREEGDYLRPVVDGFGIYYIRFDAEWDESSTIDAEAQFGELLLTPSARSATLKDFAEGFFNPASAACFILGRERCVERIRSLAALGEPALRESACGFLKSEYRLECTP